MMRRIALALVVGAFLAVAQGAQAQEQPCDPATPAAARFTGLPDNVIYGREYPFGVDDGGSYVDSFAVTMLMNGQPFWSGNYDPVLDDGLYIRADPGDTPLTVNASYSEDYDDWNFDDGYQSTCARTISKTVNPSQGSRPPSPWLKHYAPFERGSFVIPKRADCKTRYNPSPVFLSVKPANGEWDGIGASDQCYGWDTTGASGHNFRLSGEGRVATFTPRTAARNSTKRFKWRLRNATVDENTVTEGNKTLKRGTITVRTEHYPAERVYAWKKNGDINDRYWNYCVNEGKQTWMHNGNPYCIEPSLTYRNVTIR